MERNHFLQACKLLNANLLNQVMDRAYNSIGSNVFFEFGKQKEIALPNGKKRLQKEWSIWLSWTSWRITQHNKYLIGSNESLEINVQSYLERLLGKRLLSFCFISQFLDIQINFEDGYQVTTFFNRVDENQWLVFFPNETEIVVDCSSEEKIKKVQCISENLDIESKYKKSNSLLLDAEMREIFFNENEISKLMFTKSFSIDLGLCAWRLEKSNVYCIGRKDYYFGCLEGRMKELQNTLLGLIGKRIRYMSEDSSGMDVRLEFEEEYVLEIFSQAQTSQWKIYQKGKIVSCARSST